MAKLYYIDGKLFVDDQSGNLAYVDGNLVIGEQAASSSVPTLSTPTVTSIDQTTATLGCTVTY